MFWNQRLKYKNNLIIQLSYSSRCEEEIFVSFVVVRSLLRFGLEVQIFRTLLVRVHLFSLDFVFDLLSYFDSVWTLMIRSITFCGLKLWTLWDFGYSLGYCNGRWDPCGTWNVLLGYWREVKSLFLIMTWEHLKE